MVYFTTTILKSMLKNAKTKHEKRIIIMFIRKKILESNS